MDLTEFKNNSQKAIAALKEDLKTIRTGRANPAMIEGIEVEAYGGSTTMRLKEMATMTTEGATAIIIAPFDPSTANDIERAIMKSPLGLTPQNQGTTLIVRIPPLSQEQREKLIKVVSGKIEEKKNTIRYQRDDVRKKIKAMLEKKELTEDDKFRMEKEIDSMTTNFMTEVEDIKTRKEEEMRQI